MEYAFNSGSTHRMLKIVPDDPVNPPIKVAKLKLLLVTIT